jgi:hypothetical protein
MEEEEDSTHAVIEEGELDFRDLAARALEKTGMKTEERMRVANNLPPTALPQDRPALVEANNDEIMYGLTFNLPNAGLGVVEPNIPPAEPTLGDD